MEAASRPNLDRTRPADLARRRGPISLHQYGSRSYGPASPAIASAACSPVPIARPSAGTASGRSARAGRGRGRRRHGQVVGRPACRRPRAVGRRSRRDRAGATGRHRCDEDHVCFEGAVGGGFDRVLRRALDMDTTEEAHAEIVQRDSAERGQRVVEPIERTFEHVDEGDRVARGGEGRSAFGPIRPAPTTSTSTGPPWRSGARRSKCWGFALTSAVSRPGTGGGPYARPVASTTRSASTSTISPAVSTGGSAGRDQPRRPLRRAGRCRARPAAARRPAARSAVGECRLRDGGLSTGRPRPISRGESVARQTRRARRAGHAVADDRDFRLHPAPVMGRAPRRARRPPGTTRDSGRRRRRTATA